MPASELQAISAANSTVGSLLLIGNDGSLQHSRQLLLQRAGFTIFALNSQQALAGETPLACRMALICRSVEQREAQWIAQLLHASEPRLPILRFATSGETVSPEFAAFRRESAAPSVLLAEVRRLLSA